MDKVEIETQIDRRPEICEQILRGLPDWFGLESALVDYCRESGLLAMLVAKTNGDRVVGFVSLRHRPGMAAEIHVMGVLPHYHRRGIDHSLIEASVRAAKHAGARLLEVKTLGPSHPKQNGYLGTRRFYEREGFLPVEELLDLWPSNPCLIMVKPL